MLGSATIDGEQVAWLRQWEGRVETTRDRVSLAQAKGLAATLDRDLELAEGVELPPLWHWLCFLPQAKQAELGADGHPRLGGFLPPVPLPRRMWGGGRLQWHAPLRIGDEVTRTSRIASISHKAGRSGDLLFVLVRHEVATANGLALTEDQDIVYRSAAGPGDAAAVPEQAPAAPAWSRQIHPDPVLLFRYSALTFNGHRIHYDRRFATEAEGYPGLVVHGPLLAMLLADLVAREQTGTRLNGFAFKAIRPTFDQQPFRVCGRPEKGNEARLWVQDLEGHLAMRAEAQFTS
jgi:3-methylfumaryl-CoA hydratase